jgi:hypothetical protein
VQVILRAIEDFIGQNGVRYDPRDRHGPDHGGEGDDRTTSCLESGLTVSESDEQLFQNLRRRGFGPPDRATSLPRAARGQIVLTHAVYDAIASTLPKGAARWPMQREQGQCFIQVEAAVVDRMRAMRRPGESYSEVIDSPALRIEA